MFNLVCCTRLAVSRSLCRPELQRLNYARSKSSSIVGTGSTSDTSPSPPAGGPKKLLSSIVEEEALDPPIKFSTSRASKWKAHDTHTNINTDTHPYTAPIFSVFTAILLLYFCVFREENDVDEEMKKSLWERIPGLERQQLDVVLEYNKQVGLPTDEIRKRIAELDGKPIKP